MSDTNIPVTNEVWAYLDAQKGRNESFDDVLREELNIEQADSTGPGADD